MPGVAHTTGIAGQSFTLNANGSNFGQFFVTFDDFDKRRDPSLTADGHHRPGAESCSTRKCPRRMTSLFTPPPVSGLGSASGFKIIIEDRGDLGLDGAAEADRRPHRRGRRRATRSRTCSRVFRANMPQLYVDLDRDQCQTMGVNPGDVFSTLQIYLGSLLRQRLQPLRPHLAGGRPGDRRVPRRPGQDQAAQGAQRRRRDGAARVRC